MMNTAASITIPDLDDAMAFFKRCAENGMSPRMNTHGGGFDIIVSTVFDDRLVIMAGAMNIDIISAS